MAGVPEVQASILEPGEQFEGSSALWGPRTDADKFEVNSHVAAPFYAGLNFRDLLSQCHEPRDPHAEAHLLRGLGQGSLEAEYRTEDERLVGNVSSEHRGDVQGAVGDEARVYSHSNSRFNAHEDLLAKGHSPAELSQNSNLASAVNGHANRAIVASCATATGDAGHQYES